MADDEIAAPDSSGDDYSPEEAKKTIDEGAITVSKKNKFTCFDLILVLIFITLVFSMLFLKYREETFLKQKNRLEVNIKVTFKYYYRQIITMH